MSRNAHRPGWLASAEKGGRGDRYLDAGFARALAAPATVLVAELAPEVPCWLPSALLPALEPDEPPAFPLELVPALPDDVPSESVPDEAPEEAPLFEVLLEVPSVLSEALPLESPVFALLVPSVLSAELSVCAPSFVLDTSLPFTAFVLLASFLSASAF